MNFSSEEIFSMFGQYDKFVSISFHYDSEARKKYKASIMGIFKYTLEEREQLEKTIRKQNISRTNTYIKFIPSDLEVLNDNQKMELDKNGFQCADIFEISSTVGPVQNRFSVQGDKELQNVIKINFDPSGTSLQLLELNNLSMRLDSGYKLFEEELNRYWGYQLFFNPEKVTEEELTKLIDPLTGRLKDDVRFYQLKAEYYNTESPDPPSIIEEFRVLLERRSQVKSKFLIEELKKSSEKLSVLGKKYNDRVRTIILFSIDFEDEVILPYELPIWWDFERFLHIYMRHVKETKVGERFEDKTIFQYKLQDIRRLVSRVLDTIYKEILQHFNDNPTATFKRIGKRSVYYDGNYYRVEIEPSGRLITFHPYNDNKIISQDVEPST